jgi:hypothetical protein
MTMPPDLLPIIVGAVFGGMIFVGVVLPAVWSAKPERRAAALATLKELLTVIRHQRRPDLPCCPA